MGNILSNVNNNHKKKISELSKSIAIAHSYDNVVAIMFGDGKFNMGQVQAWSSFASGSQDAQSLFFKMEGNICMSSTRRKTNELWLKTEWITEKCMNRAQFDITLIKGIYRENSWWWLFSWTDAHKCNLLIVWPLLTTLQVTAVPAPIQPDWPQPRVESNKRPDHLTSSTATLTVGQK